MLINDLFIDTIAKRKKYFWIRRKRKEKNQGSPAVDQNMNAQYANGLSAYNYKPHSVAFRCLYLLYCYNE